jgi:hypothetical protein
MDLVLLHGCRLDHNLNGVIDLTMSLVDKLRGFCSYA